MATELLFSESVHIIIIYTVVLFSLALGKIQKLINKCNLFMKVTSN